jgi:hypothetical protein
LAQLVRPDVLLQVVAAEEATALESLVAMQAVAAAQLALQVPQLQLPELRTRAAAVAVQASAAVVLVHGKVVTVVLV